MYDIFVSEQANKDFDDLEFVVKYEYQSPQTAFRYLRIEHKSFVYIHRVIPASLIIT